jgi:hypothetical protein
MVKRPGREVATHLHLVSRLRMSVTIPLLPIYFFIACTGSLSLLFTFCVYVGFQHSLPLLNL